jgi:uncharacterized protein CbrC (UPF0167 family)
MGFLSRFKKAEGKKEINATQDLPANFPKFRYYPDPFPSDIVKRDVPCPCCGKVTGYVYRHTPYCVDEIEDICPWCIADGSAAIKFDCVFNDSLNIKGIPSERVDELIRRTPGLITWQDLDWPVHCNDFYSFVGYVNHWDFIKEKKIEKEIIQDLSENDDGLSVREVKNGLRNDGSMGGYLFRCLHCGKYHLHVDFD